MKNDRKSIMIKYRSSSQYIIHRMKL